MTTYQVAVRSTAGRIDIAALYEKFLGWWASLYTEVKPGGEGSLV